MEWPHAGVPADAIAEFTGLRIATLPPRAPETVTTDHGDPYKNPRPETRTSPRDRNAPSDPQGGHFAH